MGRAAIDALPPVAAVAAKAPLADVFKGQYLKLTLLLVFAYFAHITSFYYILKWVAPIVSQLGYSPSTSPTCCSGRASAARPAARC